MQAARSMRNSISKCPQNQQCNLYHSLWGKRNVVHWHAQPSKGALKAQEEAQQAVTQNTQQGTATAAEGLGNTASRQVAAHCWSNNHILGQVTVTVAVGCSSAQAVLALQQDISCPVYDEFPC